jgi:LysR family hca operon transcriptional activator
MELRHLRYFVAIAEEGSFSRAAEQRLHTAQPSLSRQIRDLEATIGAQLIVRRPRGMELTDAGRVFLEHARGILLQVDSATEATRRASRPARAPFAVGFLTGSEMDWLPKILETLRDDPRRTELTIHSASSPELEQGLLHGRIDLAFLRPGPDLPELEFKRVTDEELFVLLPAGHRLASRRSIRAEEMANETFVSFTKSYAPALRKVIDGYLARCGVELVPAHEAETLPMVISLVLSSGGISFLPDYAGKLLPPSVVRRKLHGEAPVIPLAMGYNRSNASPLLRLILAKVGGDEFRVPRPPAPPASH